LTRGFYHSEYHWGQSPVSQPGTSQTHCKDMDKVLVLIPMGFFQLHSEFPLPVYLRFTNSVIFKDIPSVPTIYPICFTSNTPLISMWCTHPGHRDYIFPVHLKFSHCSFPYQFSYPVNRLFIRNVPICFPYHVPWSFHVKYTTFFPQQFLCDVPNWDICSVPKV
jgi:hypothetical protein